MLHEALEYKVALNRYAVEQYHVGPTELEWQKAESLLMYSTGMLLSSIM
jgi:hypothetical protein